jgi:hypothetical protein
VNVDNKDSEEIKSLIYEIFGSGVEVSCKKDGIYLSIFDEISWGGEGMSLSRKEINEDLFKFLKKNSIKSSPYFMSSDFIGMIGFDDFHNILSALEKERSSRLDLDILKKAYFKGLDVELKFTSESEFVLVANVSLIDTGKYHRFLEVISNHGAYWEVQIINSSVFVSIIFPGIIRFLERVKKDYRL